MEYFLLQYSTKDERHKGEYKKISNTVAAYDETGKEVGIVFETTTPFETPLRMSKLIEWTQKNKVVIVFDLINQSFDEFNSPVFESEVLIEGIHACKGKGYSKKESPIPQDRCRA